MYDNYCMNNDNITLRRNDFIIILSFTTACRVFVCLCVYVCIGVLCGVSVIFHPHILT